MIKKLLVAFFSLILISASLFNLPTIYAKSPDYAQIKNSSTYIYKSAELNESISNKLCLVENSYFVKILNNFNDVFYKVEYNGITGYVKKENINLINETPINPYTNNIYFNINNTSCYFRSSPKIKDTINNTICTINAGTKGLRYIGKIIGEEAIDFNGTIWYLTEFNGVLGYVYSAYTNSLNTIFENTEQISLFTGFNYSKVNPLTNTTCIFVILITLIPFLFILFLIYLPRKKLSKANIKHNTKPESVDYYEENL